MFAILYIKADLCLVTPAYCAGPMSLNALDNYVMYQQFSGQRPKNVPGSLCGKRGLYPDLGRYAFEGVILEPVYKCSFIGVAPTGEYLFGPTVPVSFYDVLGVNI